MWRPKNKQKHALPVFDVPSVEEASQSLLFSSLDLPSGVRLADRTWVPAMVPWRATEEGFVTPAVLAWYARFAKGEPGAIVVEATGVRDVPSGPLLRIGHDRFTPGLTELCRIVREASHGRTKLFIQLIDFLRIRRRPERARYLRSFLRLDEVHKDGLARETGQRDILEASEADVREALVQATDEVLARVLLPRELEALRMGERERVTDVELQHIAELPAVLPTLFADAAARAKEAGFDGVELHFAHAYTMASFLSRTNTRADGYGTTLDGRARLAIEVLAAVRERVGRSFTIGCRMLADEIIEGGTRPADAGELAVRIAPTGLDYLSLSTGGKFDDAAEPRVGEAAYPYTGESGYECMPTVHSDARGPFGRNVGKQAIVRRALRDAGIMTPVAVAGGIGTFAMAEGILQRGEADIIAAARQSLADPDWWKKVRLGRGGEVRRCLYTNYCEALDQRHKVVTCQQWDREALDEVDALLSPDGTRRLVAPDWPAPWISRPRQPILAAMPAPSFPDDFNLADYFLFDRLGEGLGEKAAVLFGAERHTYADVARRTRELQRFFAERGVRREERVLIVLHDTPAFVWAFFATLHHGAVVTMGNPDAPAADLAYLLEYTRASVLITIPRVAADLSGPIAASDLRALVLAREVATGEDVLAPLSVSNAMLVDSRVVSLGDALSEGSTLLARNADAPRPTKRDDVAIWLFTSGSTGKSKANIHAHRDFGFNTECYAKRTVAYRPDDVTLSVPRLFFGYATGTNLMFPFAVGATTALFAERPTPESLTAAIERHKPTVVTNVPTMMSKLLEHDAERTRRGAAPLDLGSVRFHLSAGEALPPTLLSRFRERFGGDVYDGIGSAEMFHIYASNRPGDIMPGSLGRAVEGYDIKILPAEAEEPGGPALPPNETGVMWVKGESAAMGYFEDREKSFRTFLGPWCRTGDLFRIDAEGYLWFSGRADDLLKVSGVWVAPVEVEECLLSHPEVALAAVIGAEEDGLTKVKAFVVLKDAASRDESVLSTLAAELKEYVKSKLSKHKYPRFIVFVSDVPKNDRGKVDKKVLKEREAAGESPRGH